MQFCGILALMFLNKKYSGTQMIRISLSEAEIIALKTLRMNRKSAARERAHYVLLVHEGKSPPEIAEQLDRNINTIKITGNREREYSTMTGSFKIFSFS